MVAGTDLKIYAKAAKARRAKLAKTDRDPTPWRADLRVRRPIKAVGDEVSDEREE